MGLLILHLFKLIIEIVYQSEVLLHYFRFPFALEIEKHSFQLGVEWVILKTPFLLKYISSVSVYRNKTENIFFLPVPRHYRNLYRFEIANNMGCNHNQIFIRNAPPPSLGNGVLRGCIHKQ